MIDSRRIIGAREFWLSLILLSYNLLSHSYLRQAIASTRLPEGGTGKYAKFAKPAGEGNELEWDITDNVAVVMLNGEVIEKAWKIGGSSDRGVGLQKERGDFELRYIRIKEKK